MKNWREAENERSLKFFTYKQWNWNSAISFISYFTKVKLCTLLHRVCDLIRRDKIYQKSSFFCSTMNLKINQIDDNFLNKFFLCVKDSRDSFVPSDLEPFFFVFLFIQLPHYSHYSYIKSRELLFLSSFECAENKLEAKNGTKKNLKFETFADSVELTTIV